METMTRRQEESNIQRKSKDKIGPEELVQWEEQFHAINMYTLSIIGYPDGIVSKQKEDMEAAEVRTWKLLTI